jgi:hypothetical protein
MRDLNISATVSVIVLFLWILAGAILGGCLSFYTGKQGDVPKWNGWDYFWFSVGEFAMMSAILAIPVAFIAFCSAWVTLKVTKGNKFNKSDTTAQSR